MLIIKICNETAPICQAKDSHRCNSTTLSLSLYIFLPLYFSVSLSQSLCCFSSIFLTVRSQIQKPFWLPNDASLVGPMSYYANHQAMLAQLAYKSIIIYAKPTPPSSTDQRICRSLPLTELRDHQSWNYCRHIGLACFQSICIDWACTDQEIEGVREREREWDQERLREL